MAYAICVGPGAVWSVPSLFATLWVLYNVRSRSTLFALKMKQRHNHTEIPLDISMGRKNDLLKFRTSMAMCEQNNSIKSKI